MRFSFLVSVSLSALPIKRCLDLGADIVVTGRCVDSAVVLGPLMHSVRFVMQERSSDFLCNRHCVTDSLVTSNLLVICNLNLLHQHKTETSYTPPAYLFRSLASTGRGPDFQNQKEIHIQI